MKNISLLKTILPIVLALVLNACSSGARMSAMVVPITPENIITEESKLYQSIELSEVSGGKKTNPLWTSQVGDEEFLQALLNSLKAHALISVGEAKYRLIAKLIKIKQPLVGFDLTVKSTIQYELLEINTQKIVYNEQVYVEYTAAFGDSLLGSKRLQLANEGAIKDNISKFITTLISLFKSDTLVVSKK